MIDHIRGKLAFKSPTYVRVETNGLGYGIHIPLSTYEQLKEINENVSLYTYLHVREDCLELFGFKTPEEKDLFEMLLSVSGVGPRLALRILSGLSVGKLKESISQGNVEALTVIPGVGKKTAQRLIVELREKIGLNLETVDKSLLGKTSAEQEIAQHAVSALTSLGCKSAAAAKAVKEAKASAKKELSLESLVKEALKHL